MGKGGLLHSYRLSLRLLSVSPRCGLPGRSIVVCMHCCAVHNNCPVTLCTGPYFYTGGSDRLKLKDRSQTVLWCWTYNNLLQYEYLTYPAPLPPRVPPYLSSFLSRISSYPLVFLSVLSATAAATTTSKIKIKN